MNSEPFNMNTNFTSSLATSTDVRKQIYLRQLETIHKLGDKNKSMIEEINMLKAVPPTSTYAGSAGTVEDKCQAYRRDLELIETICIRNDGMRDRMVQLKVFCWLYADSICASGNESETGGSASTLTQSEEDGSSTACGSDDDTAGKARPKLQVDTNIPRDMDYGKSPNHPTRPTLSLDTNVPLSAEYSKAELNNQYTPASIPSSISGDAWAEYMPAPNVEDKWAASSEDSGLGNNPEASVTLSKFKSVIVEVNRLQAEIQFLNFDLAFPNTKGDDELAFRPVWQWHAEHFSDELMTELDQNMFLQDLPAKLVREILAKIGQDDAVSALVEALIQMMETLLKFLELKLMELDFERLHSH